MRANPRPEKSLSNHVKSSKLASGKPWNFSERRNWSFPKQDCYMSFPLALQLAGTIVSVIGLLVLSLIPASTTVWLSILAIGIAMTLLGRFGE
jgi:predicted signal transduction protein with EAL and GGDEF domain